MRLPIRGVIFDLDDTLHDDTEDLRHASEATAQEVVAAIGGSASALRTAYLETSGRFWHELTVGTLPTAIVDLRRRMWGEALGACGLDPAEADRCVRAFARFRGSGATLFPGAPELLDRLRDRGCRLGLLTNGLSETHREKIERLALADRFDAILIADEIGMCKPDPAVFRHACEAIGTIPAETAMVGDRYDRDVAGALAVGMRAVLLRYREETIPPGAAPPTATIDRIGDLDAALFAEAAAR